MRLLIKLLFGLAFLLVVAAFALPMVLSGDWVKQKVETAASEATGRAVTIGDNPSISVFPPSIKVNALTVANADGFSAPYLLSVDQAELGVKLAPLFSKKVELTAFRLTNPDIRLQTNKAGKANWVLGGSAPAPTDSDNGALPVSDVSLGDVVISNGKIVFESGDGGVWNAENANLTMRLTSLDDATTLNGKMTLQGEPATVSATFDTPRSFLEAGAATLTLDATVGKNSAKTSLDITNPMSFSGNLDVDIPALRSLIALAGAKIETPNGFERARLRGEVSGDADTLAFKPGTELLFDDITGTGNITIELSGPRPKISGAFSSPKLDLTPYLPEPTQAKPSPGAGFPAWSDDPMDFSALRTADFDLKLTADAIKLPTLDVGRSVVDVTGSAGRVVATLKESALYGGTGSGTVTLDARAGRAVRIVPDVTLTGINVGDFADAFAGVDRLVGKGDLRIDLATSGRSQAEWVNNLDGDVTLAVDKGALKGINLGKIARGTYDAYQSLREGGINSATVLSTLSTLTTSARGPAETTDFSSMDVGLDLTKGAAVSRRINISGPYFAITGDANINLGRQEMRMTLTPSVSAVEGEGKVTMPVPILVSGTFSQPKIGLDTGPLIRNAATKGVSDVLKKQGIDVPDGAGSVEDVLKGAANKELGKLLGTKKDGKDDAAPEGDEEAAAPDPTDQLIQLGVGALLGGNNDDEQGKDESATPSD